MSWVKPYLGLAKIVANRHNRGRLLLLGRPSSTEARIIQARSSTYGRECVYIIGPVYVMVNVKEI